MRLSRRNFLSGGAMLAAAGVLKPAMGMQPEEQAAWDAYAAAPAPKPDKLLDSGPVLQVPAETSMGVAFAVNALANGFAEVADNPGMKDARRFFCEGVPQAKIDERVMQVRVTGLKPDTKYWYRAGAAALSHPVGYWAKPSAIEWTHVHSFSTCGAGGASHFAVMNDTHARWDAFKLVTEKICALGVPVAIWNGDASNTSWKRETAVEIFLKPQGSEGYAADIPVFFNNGNHDFRGNANVHLDSVMMTRLPTERSARDWALTRNFAVRQGGIALIGLDTGEDKPDRHPANGGFSRFELYRTMQTAWLEDQFKRPEIASAPYVVAFCHIPLFDSRPDANPGTILEDWADWQKQCADEWGPVLGKNRVQLVVAAHKHCYRCDPATPSRPWTQIVGGGPEMGYRGWGANKVPDTTRFPTVIEGKVSGGELEILVHDVLHGTLAGRHVFKPRNGQGA